AEQERSVLPRQELVVVLGAEALASPLEDAPQASRPPALRPRAAEATEAREEVVAERPASCAQLWPRLPSPVSPQRHSSQPLLLLLPGRGSVCEPVPPLPHQWNWSVSSSL